MSNTIHFCLAFHNHQPVGNFDHVFEQAYRDSYLPFLDVFEKFEQLSISLHTSGPLMEWLDKHHGDYVDRLASLVDAGRIEIIGGAFYEPILSMIPSRDRIGQITSYTSWLKTRLSAEVRGMWMPERVWEQSLTVELATAGIEYTILDDFHFRNSGLSEDQLHGHFVTEDQGYVLSVFPGSERMRYLIPFGSPEETIEHLRAVADRHADAVVVFGDDGEKFGTWPDTKRHVYDGGWLHRFFSALTENSSWVKVSTLSDALSNTLPLGKVFLPDASYREMTEWALPTERQSEYEEVVHQFENDDRWPSVRQFIRGGYWRNFKVKYPESDEMYSRMMFVSQRLKDIKLQDADRDLVEAAQRELYRGQCNCSYWHGAFGGIYLPHLRNAVYNHLIAADNLLDQASGKPRHWVELSADDFNLDTRQEVKLASDRLVGLLCPARGGHLYELDVRSVCLNLLATLPRRAEVYHQKVKNGSGGNGNGVASIHERVIFKQEGLDQLLQYDRFPRKSLVDHFYDDDVQLEQVARGEGTELGDFAEAKYEARLRRNPDRVQVQLVRDGQAAGANITLTKAVSLEAGSSTLEISYKLEHLPTDKQFHFGIEFNFAGLPANADDRFFYQDNHNRLGHLGSHLNLTDAKALGMVDQWLGIDVNLVANRPTHFWAFPVQTVSQSEGGFELVHQSVVVQPHWFVRADQDGRWGVTMKLLVDTSQAEQRMIDHEATVTV